LEGFSNLAVFPLVQNHGIGNRPTQPFFAGLGFLLEKGLKILYLLQPLNVHTMENTCTQRGFCSLSFAITSLAADGI
jgi:hypothetical protein